MVKELRSVRRSVGPWRDCNVRFDPEEWRELVAGYRRASNEVK